jgi:Ca2+-binding RTX toxin-like protein
MVDLLAGGIGGDALGDVYINMESVIGTAFSDAIRGNAAIHQILKGEAGNDTLEGRQGGDQLHGGIGNDQILAGLGDDYIEGGAGADTLDGNAGPWDRIVYTNSAAGISIDLATGAASGGDAAGDRITGVEALFGSAHNDRVLGTAGSNDINTGDGNDTIDGRGGDDWLDGSGGNDRILGGGGNDELLAGDGDDEVDGGSGNENLYGGKGDDDLDGEDGNDTVWGERGVDTLEGGDGNDTFLFYEYGETGMTAATRDLIEDFARGEDVIQLYMDANRNTPMTDEAFTFIGNTAFRGNAGELRYFFSNGNTIVAADLNGDRLGDFQIELEGQLNLTATDFIL